VVRSGIFDKATELPWSCEPRTQNRELFVLANLPARWDGRLTHCQDGRTNLNVAFVKDALGILSDIQVTPSK
jgi:hypothetical protein